MKVDDKIQPLKHKIKIFDEKLDREIKSFEAKRADNKNKAFLSKILTTVFSALTTILLGLQGFDTEVNVYFKNIAFVLSAFVTLFNTWDAFFNHRAIWIAYTETSRRLQIIKDELEYRTSGENPMVKEADIDRLFRQYRLVLAENSRSWLQARKDDEQLKPEG